jgi:hypothetical protein
VGQDGAHGPKGGVDIEVEHAVPRVGITVDHLAADIGTGIGMENVELAGIRQDLRHHGGYACWVGEIDHQRNGFGTEIGADLPQPLLGPVDEHDASAVREKRFRAFEANARGRAGDRRDFS